MGSNNIGEIIEDSIAAAHVILSISETKHYYCCPWGENFGPDLCDIEQNDQAVVVSGRQIQDLMRKAPAAAYNFGNGNTGIGVSVPFLEIELFFVEDRSGKPPMDLSLFVRGFALTFRPYDSSEVKERTIDLLKNAELIS